jgi:hypothetical protein
MSRHNMLEQYDRVTKSYAMQQRLRRNDAADDEETDDDELGGNGDTDHVGSQIADLLVQAGSSDGPVDRETALRWLLHSKDGRALLVQLSPYRKAVARTNRKGFQMPTRQEVLKGYVRSAGGVVPLCKRIVAKGTTDITEHELVSLLVTELKRAEPDLSDAQAFTKAFTGPSGAMLQKAVQVAKVAQVSGNDDDDDDDAAAALEELQRLADAHQRKHPELTGQQAFARVFSDPRHAALAHRAHKRPTANEKNAFPFPR